MQEQQMVFHIFLHPVQQFFLIIAGIPVLCFFVLLPSSGYQLAVLFFVFQDHFLRKCAHPSGYGMFPCAVHPAQQGYHFPGPLIPAVFTILFEISYDVDIALTMPCSEMIQGCLMVMHKDACKFRKKPQFFHAIKCLILHRPIDYCFFHAEVPDITRFPVQRHHCRIRHHYPVV